ncbi:MAG: hypothetical protein FJZ90_05490 [Chloroflexi bacterium]|nr:hypothetical protein [Chloroflexota bacterium]
MSTRVKRSLALEPIPDAAFAFHGLVGHRLEANLEQWLLVAPQANPAMLEMFRDRDRTPRRDLVPWAGEFAGKYLTSAALAHRLSRDERLRAQLDMFVDALIGVQAEDGYLGPFPTHERLTGKTADGKHALWDLWGHYHCMLGLLMWYQQTGYEPALAACRRAADHLCRRFLDTGERVLDAGAEEMNMAVSHGLALLYQETGEERYLRLVREIERDWQTPPAGDYVRTALAGIPFYQTPKPRWESLHDIQAILTLHEVTGETQYRQAFEHIWRSIRETDRHNTGGFSSGEKAQGSPYHPGAIETCCTVAWMALSVDMLRLTGDAQAADELELSTLNAAPGAQSPSGRWWTYNTPMDGVRKASAHEIVFQAREGSPELNCCSVNGPRSLGMLADWAIMRGTDGAVVLNYYGPSAFAVTLPSGGRLQLTQNTEYPREGHIEIVVGLERDETFPLQLRIPAWSRRTLARVNGEPLEAHPGNYLTLERTWRNGDTISLDLDMSLRVWRGERELEGKVCLFRGPVLLAYDRRFSDMDPDAVPAPDLEHLGAEMLPWRGAWPTPWVLLRLQAANGRDLVLCDYATAGATGAPYLTWLPGR